ncbi:hypothetical protein [Actinoallomurus iriomotensis]|uniref:Uncharacterized protein n=1 Tax=Actinoallomurus iriomotensis TaxID=478107 RepID=A0A9W6VUR5_9ACTN|nr:hypothetical protein [Actinoallomurus iriomotensis]GLY85898.1 hypothetical protein Airi02_038270 [Actinoallomurus iriomotensis]
MSHPDERVNPFCRDEGHTMPNPPLKCLHPESCTCHVDVDHAGESYELFRTALNGVGTLQQTGLFVAVGGPTGCGKTSLVNRCAVWAQRHLEDKGVKTLPLNFSGLERDGQTIDRRVHKVGTRMYRAVSRNQQLVEGDLPPIDWSADLEELTFTLSTTMKPETALIVVAPPAERSSEVAEYWAATHRKMLVFSESADESLQRRKNEWKINEVAQPIYLRTGPLRPGDGAVFRNARINVPGLKKTFPDLAPDAIDALTGGQELSIGFVQTLLWKIYEHYKSNPWPTGDIVTLDDLTSFIAGELEGRAG